MTPQRLSWRIGLPFGLFVLAGSAVLAMWMSWRNVLAERDRLAALAASNAGFLRQSHLPPSERMARQLAEVLDARVVFARGEQFVPPSELSAFPKTALDIHRIPADGNVRTGLGSRHEAVKSALEDGWDLVLWWPRMWPWSRMFARESLPVLACFWLLAFGFGWLITRGLVRPLRHLAARLPDIEKPGALDLPEADREDEIGDVARAFVRTRKALQDEREQRERAEKLAVLGRMTAALAHEIQNPVAAIKLHAQLLPVGSEAAEVIAGEVRRIEGLVNQWMFLSRPEGPVMTPVPLSRVLAASVSAHRLQLEHAQVKAEAVIEEDLVVRGDERRLAQVFSNLITNAVQAMPRGGVLKIEAQRNGDAMAEITFADSGSGFSGVALARFAEYFFSEKEGGMGIGLSVASEIVAGHGGELLAANRGEGGARVTVRLPVCVL